MRTVRLFRLIKARSGRSGCEVGLGVQLLFLGLLGHQATLKNDPPVVARKGSLSAVTLYPGVLLMIFSLGFISEATPVPRGAMCRSRGVPGTSAQWLHCVSESLGLLTAVFQPDFGLVHGEGQSCVFDLTA